MDGPASVGQRQSGHGEDLYAIIWIEFISYLISAVFSFSQCSLLLPSDGMGVAQAHNLPLECSNINNSTDANR